MNDDAARSVETFLTTHHNVSSIGQWPEFFRYGIIVLSPHDYIVGLCGLHEIFHVVGKVPGEVVVFSNDSVF